MSPAEEETRCGACHGSSCRCRSLHEETTRGRPLEAGAASCAASAERRAVRRKPGSSQPRMAAPDGRGRRCGSAGCQRCRSSGLWGSESMDRDSPRSNTEPADPRQRASRSGPPSAPRASDAPPRQARAADGAAARISTPAPNTGAGVHGDETAAGLRGLLSRLPLRQVIVFAIAIVGLYFVWPQLVSLFSHAATAARHLLVLVRSHGRARGGQLRLRLGAHAPGPETSAAGF